MLRSLFRQSFAIAGSCVLLVVMSLFWTMSPQPAYAQSFANQDSAGTQSANVSVSSNVQWVDTGIILGVGTTLKISANGSWSADPAYGFTTPDGYTQQSADNFFNLSDLGACASCASTPMPNWGALIGYIGNTPPAAGSYTSTSVLSDAQKVFVVGSSFQSNTKPAGKLWLTFNDDAYSGYTSDNAGQVTAIVTATAPKPGGMWITKTGFNVAVGKNFTFQAYAYPTNKATDPAIAHVNFTATWPGHGWVDICGSVTKHSLSNMYSCSTDFTKLNGGILVPQGSITVTFNVTDTQGNVNDAPNGSIAGKIVYSTNTKVDKAIAWAMGQMTKPSQNWDGLCEAFVEHAYGVTKGTGGGGYLTAQDDANANLKHTTGTPNIGALVFFKYYNPKDKNWDGHVGIYLGGNLFISATNNNIQIFDKDYWANTYAHEPYEGWGDVPSSWPGR